MDTRMSKYDKEEVKTPSSRVSKNASLYEQINDQEINEFTLRSNATVLGRQEPEIDIEKIKKILDTKYNELPKRKSIRIEQEETKEVETESPTKEYDLNAILDKAKEEKQESYEEVRAKKLRDTQFDILKNLHIDEPKISEEKDENAKERPEDNDLLNLINTITLNEEKEKSKKDDNLNIEKVKSKEEDNEIEQDDLLKEQKKMLEENKEKQTVTNSLSEIKKEIAKIENTSPVMTKTSEENKLDNSFYTQRNLFKKKDFSNDDDDDDDDKLSIGVKILIVITIIGIAIGMYFFIKSIIGF